MGHWPPHSVLALSSEVASITLGLLSDGLRGPRDAMPVLAAQRFAHLLGV